MNMMSREPGPVRGSIVGPANPASETSVGLRYAYPTSAGLSTVAADAGEAEAALASPQLESNRLHPRNWTYGP